jgi:hypothetical protein
MPSIGLLMSVFAGLSGGLVGVLWDGLVSTPLLARARRDDQLAFRPERYWSMFGSAILLALGGAALGLLFWLGWGLISLVNLPWFVAGLLFGLLSWTGLVVPLLGGLAFRLRGFGRVAAVLALEWLVTCLAIGFFCALAWRRFV